MGSSCTCVEVIASLLIDLPAVIMQDQPALPPIMPHSSPSVLARFSLPSQFPSHQSRTLLPNKRLLTSMQFYLSQSNPLDEVLDYQHWATALCVLLLPREPILRSSHY